MNHACNDKCVDTIETTLERPRYSPGLILEDSDLTAAVDYTRNLNRLLFRSLFGCGVVCGLTVSVNEACGLKIDVQPGLALNACGDPIELTKVGTIVLNKSGSDFPGGEKDFWVLLRNKEKPWARRPLVCDGGDDKDAPPQTTRIKNCAEICVVTSKDLPKCLCEHAQWKGKRVEPFSDKKAEELIGLEDVTISLGTDCGSDCGCGGDCGCGDPVLLAWVHWWSDVKKWGVVHRGVRRFIRPTLLPDQIKDEKPK